MLGVYLDPSLLWKLPSVVAGLFLLRSPLRKMRWGQVTGLVLLAAPFLFTLCSLLLYDDADERGDSLLALWPLLLILAAVLALFNLFRLRRDLSLRPLLPIVLLVAINGTLMSQQLWGSTYAIWPLLILLIVEMIGFLAWLTSSGASPGGTPLRTAKEGEKRSSVAKACVDFAGFMRGLKPPPPSVLGLSAACLGMAPVMAAVISATLLVCGGFYTASEERLSYVQFPEGPVEHSAFPQLAGMAVPGEYLPDFDELLRFAEANIPFSDGLILMPGEDPFYFVTGRVAAVSRAVFRSYYRPIFACSSSGRGAAASDSLADREARTADQGGSDPAARGYDEGAARVISPCRRGCMGTMYTGADRIQGFFPALRAAQLFPVLLRLVGVEGAELGQRLGKAVAGAQVAGDDQRIAGAGVAAGQQFAADLGVGLEAGCRPGLQARWNPCDR